MLSREAKLAIAVVGLLLVGFATLPERGRVDVRVGSKKFTESVVLGELATHLARHEGLSAEHFQQLGGTRLVFEALKSGEIDVYTEYTGTLTNEIFAGEEIGDLESLRRRLADDGLRMTEPLGFNNTYALGMKRSRARELGIATISDLKGSAHRELKFAFSNEFLDRADGWPKLQRAYGLPQTDVAGMDHDLAYKNVVEGAADVIDIYSTDAKIATADLVLLADDARVFPRYDAVLLYRAELANKHPGFTDRLEQLAGRISAEEMTQMNRLAESKQNRQSEGRVAADFLLRELGLDVEVEQTSAARRILKRTLEHLDMVRRSLIPAILFAVPLGVLCWKMRNCGQVVLWIVGVVQTIPALALLVLLIPLARYLGWGSVGSGSTTAIIALFLYSLLPIVRNTFEGLAAIPPQHAESAQALGLSARFRLIHVELPLAAPMVLAGIKTAAVMNVGFATLGALIGAGGYGQPILTGIRLMDTPLILQGAVPAALLAVVMQAGLELATRWVVSPGLRSGRRVAHVQ